MNTRNPEPNEKERLLGLEEDHFNDLKSQRVKPSTLQEHFVSFANSDGGELFVGVEDRSEKGERLVGFASIEDANDHIHTLLEGTEPAVENVDVEFIDFGEDGYVLHFSIPKSTRVHYTAAGKCFIRMNARKKEIRGERITALAYAKGHLAYEKQPVDGASVAELEDSPHLDSYLNVLRR